MTSKKFSAGGAVITNEWCSHTQGHACDVCSYFTNLILFSFLFQIIPPDTNREQVGGLFLLCTKSCS